MNTISVTPFHSSSIQELTELFHQLRKPYGKGEIFQFNLAYQPIYPHLSRTEKHRAEKLIDAMLDNLEHESLASKIYGVV